ncbi:MAG: RNA 2',3'-cyclic phosphodiesterase [Myxococcales bacterium]|nr:RNA 2',3'-cyclic phosphodiesterase [Myxococcales bacterium]MCB9749314.1 RNA 2',3'-cyclic phosphodiesterase [Myxococcales bacterium]
MPRLFIGLDLPDLVDQQLELLHGGLPGARWEGRDKLHLTLTFLGDTDGGLARAITDALGELEAPAFELELAGVGVFPPRGQPRVIWVGVRHPEPVRELKRRVDRLLTPLGIEPERRKFAPHVTLARLKRTPERRVAEFVQAHALYACLPFRVDAVRLYSSVLSRHGSKYRVEAAFPLGRGRDGADHDDPEDM